MPIRCPRAPAASPVPCLPARLLGLALTAGVLAQVPRAQTLLYRLDGAEPGAELGTALALLGDLDGDGADDFAAGSPGEAGRRGVVRIHSGRTGAVLATLAGAGPDDFFGHALAAIDDLDGDGARDLLIGAPEREVYDGDCEASFGGLGTVHGPGYVTVVSSLAGTLYTLPAPGGPLETFGFALAGGGDVDGDGTPDFLVPLGHARRVNVHDGASGALLRVDDLGSLGSAYSAAFLGPVDATPGDEYVVGWVDYANCISGGVRAFRGGGSPFWNDVYCFSLGGEYGYFVAAPGDVDGDGVRDVVACGLDTGSFACAGFAHARTLSGLDGRLLYQSNGFKFGARGRAVAAPGDLDGDGLADLAVGEPGLLGSSGEALRVVRGPTGAPLLAIPKSGDGDGFGTSLAAGDVNGDGLPDLLVGARRDDDGGADAGAVHAYTLFVGPTVYCQAQLNSQGCAPTIFATGMPSLTYNSFRVKAAGVLNGQSGLLFFGATPKQTPFSSGGAAGGWLCVAAPQERTPVQSSGGNPPPDDCSGAFSFHFNKPYMNQAGLVPGTHVYCQYWSRDPASPATTNLTDALAFTVEP